MTIFFVKSIYIHTYLYIFIPMKNVNKENTNRETSQRRDPNTNKEPYGISISLRQFSCNASVWNRMDQQSQGKGRCTNLCHLLSLICHTCTLLLALVFPGAESAFQSLHPQDFSIEWG